MGELVVGTSVLVGEGSHCLAGLEHLCEAIGKVACRGSGRLIIEKAHHCPNSIL